MGKAFKMVSVCSKAFLKSKKVTDCKPMYPSSDRVKHTPKSPEGDSTE
jgi:hypothetical protein